MKQLNIWTWKKFGLFFFQKDRYIIKKFTIVHILIGWYVDRCDRDIFPRLGGASCSDRASTGGRGTAAGRGGRSGGRQGGGRGSARGRDGGGVVWCGGAGGRGSRGARVRLPRLRGWPPTGTRSRTRSWAFAGPVLLRHPQLVNLPHARDATRCVWTIAKPCGILERTSLTALATFRDYSDII